MAKQIKDSEVAMWYCNSNITEGDRVPIKPQSIFGKEQDAIRSMYALYKQGIERIREQFDCVEYGILDDKDVSDLLYYGTDIDDTCSNTAIINENLPSNSKYRDLTAMQKAQLDSVYGRIIARSPNFVISIIRRADNDGSIIYELNLTDYCNVEYKSMIADRMNLNEDEIETRFNNEMTALWTNIVNIVCDKYGIECL